MFGHNVGSQFSQRFLLNQDDFDMAAFLDAFKAGLAGKDNPMKKEELMKVSKSLQALVMGR